MRTLILFLFAFASHAFGQDLDTKAIEGCWDNVDQSRERGHIPFLCFKAEDVIVNFWDFSGGLDYYEVQWVFDSDSIILIHDTSCKYRLEKQRLDLSDCRFQGTFFKNEQEEPKGD
jgi:hypothetical protein